MFTRIRRFFANLLPPRDLRPEDIKPDVADDHLGPAKAEKPETDESERREEGK